MNITGRTTAIGVFGDQHQAEHALEELHRAGFSNEQLGFITRHRADDTVNEFSDETATNVPSAAAGAVGGGVIAGVLGAAASLLIPGLGIALAGGILAAVFGAVAGGFAGSLVSIGIPEEEVHYYQEQLMAGHTLVTVHAHGRYEEAIAIMRASNAFDATLMSDVPKSIETPLTEQHVSDVDTVSTAAVASPTDNATSYNKTPESDADLDTEIRIVVSPSRGVADKSTV